MAPGKFDRNAAAAPSKSLLVFRPGVEQVAGTFIDDIMQPGSKKLLRFLQSWIINTFAVLVAAIILHKHITYDNPAGESVDCIAFALGILNAFVRPILMVIALPLLIFTLGLFMFVINALLLYFVGYLMSPRFNVDSFGYAFLGALIIWIISGALNVLTGARVSVQRRGPPNPPNPPSGGGNGPVIDV